MAELSGGEVGSSINLFSGETKPVRAYGDIVVHPTKGWPWVGVVQYRTCPVCPCCGRSKPEPALLKKPSLAKHDTDSSAVNPGVILNTVVQIEEGEPVDLYCEEIIEHSSGLGQTSCCCESGAADTSEDNVVEYMEEESEGNEQKAVSSDDIFWTPAAYNNVPAVTEEKKWQILWHPTLETSPSDNTEVTVKPVRQQQYFQDGHSVHRPNSERRGLIKKVSQLVDAFVLPDCKLILKNVSCGLMDSIQVKQGFSLNDDAQDFAMYFSEVLPCDKLVPVDSFQMYPKMQVRAPYLVLENAKWEKDNYQPPQWLQAKITASKESWKNHSYGYDWWGEEDLVLDQIKNGGGLNSFVKDATFSDESSGSVKKCCSHIDDAGDCRQEGSTEDPEKGKIFAVDSHKVMGQEKANKQEPLMLSVVSVEPVKLDVEWRSHVSDEGMQEPPSENILREADFSQIKRFRVPASYVSCSRQIGTRFRYTIQEEDSILPAEKWREDILNLHSSLVVEEGVVENCHLKPGQEVFVYLVTSSGFVDILWEDGEMETGVCAEDVVPAPMPLDLNGRDYFPGMYVVGHKREDKNQFGLILKANNAEKFAEINWYTLNPIDPASSSENSLGSRNEHSFDGFQLIDLKKSEASFYDLKSHSEYNYLRGSLISKLKAENPKEPNIGYIVKKLPDGRVATVWFGGEESTSWPWELAKLHSETHYPEGSEGTLASEVEGMENQYHYYSPTDHEYDDLEDLRYYDYSSLDEEDRWKRIALMVELMYPMLCLLERFILHIHRRLPFLERKQIVKVALHCDDIISGFAHLPRFRILIENFYKDKLDLDIVQQNNRTGAAAQPYTDDQLVWNIATWMYDWLEVTAELQLAVSKQKAKEEKLKAETAQNSDMGEVSIESPQIRTGPAEKNPKPNGNNNYAGFSEENSLRKDLTALVDWHSSIQTGFTTVAQILNPGCLTEAAISLIFDCSKNLRRALNSTVLCGGDPGVEMSDPCTEELKSAFRFMKLFLANTKKVARLPCFSYTMPPESDLSLLAQKWHLFTLTDLDQPQLESDVDWMILPGEGEKQSPVVLQARKNRSIQSIIERAAVLIEDIEKGRRTMSFGMGEVLPLINDIADALCLSVAVVLRAVANLIRDELKDYVPVPPQVPDESATVATNSGDEVSDPGLPFVDSHDSGNSVNSEESQKMDLSEEVPKLDECEMALNPSSFELLSSAPTSHRFYSKSFDASIAPKAYLKAIRRELKLLRSALPPGIFVKSYEDRMDLFSCMIVGPQGTPYADGLFFFDIRLKDDYPSRPPHVFFRSLSKRLNPNLYEDGMVCLSLLGTWDGKSIQRILPKPIEPFENEIGQHFTDAGQRLLSTLEAYQGIGEDLAFPLRPVTKGFCLCIKKHADSIVKLLNANT